MKKIIQWLLASTMVVLIVIPFLRIEKDVDIEEIHKVIEKYVKEDMQKQDMKVLKANYKLQAQDVEAIVSYGPKSYINVDEISVLKQSDEAKRKVLLEKAQTHIDNLMKSFEGYGIEQTKLLKKAILVEKGNYVICIVLEKGKTLYDDIYRLFA